MRDSANRYCCEDDDSTDVLDNSCSCRYAVEQMRWHQLVLHAHPTAVVMSFVFSLELHDEKDALVDIFHLPHTDAVLAELAGQRSTV